MPPSDTGRANDVPVNDSDCPSLSLPSREADALHISYEHDGQYMSHPVHSPTPQRGYLLPYVYGPQGCRSSQDIGALTMANCNSNIISVPSQCSTKLTSFSATSIPLSQHGLVRISSRPNSCTPQAIKVSRTPTPASVNIPPPDYSPCSSPPLLRIILPMSTVSVQRWNRNITLYAVHIRMLLR